MTLGVGSVPSHRDAPYRAVRFGPRDTTVERRADGCIVLRSPHPMGMADRCVSDWLVKWAAERPEHTFLAKRDANNAWVRLTYRETLTKVRALAQALVDRQLSPERPLVILSGNDLEHALLGLVQQFARGKTFIGKHRRGDGIAGTDQRSQQRALAHDLGIGARIRGRRGVADQG